MYLQHKNRSKSVLGGFICHVILRSFYSESHPLSFKRAGFTLIELLVVVLIIGILAAIALPQYEISAAKARISEARMILKAITDAQEIYWAANGKYTADLSELDITVNTEGKYWTFSCDGGNAYWAPRQCKAMPKVEGDPKIIFHMKEKASQEAKDGFLGKHWCVGGYKTFARRVCRSIGQVDTHPDVLWADYSYYLLD